MISTVITYGPLAVAWTLNIYISIVNWLSWLISMLMFVSTVMKCLLEAHDSNPARFDRECLLHLSSRMKMWEIAAKVRRKLCFKHTFNYAIALKSLEVSKVPNRVIGLICSQNLAILPAYFICRAVPFSILAPPLL